MNKKLLSSSALVGAMLISGAALAEFKVGGDFTATYIMGTDDNTTGAKSGERIGNEVNLKMTGTATLSNGLKVEYNGKAEFDGPAGSNPDHEYEMKIGNGDMYFSFANDGGQTNKTLLTPFISYPASSTANAVTPTQTAFAADTNLQQVAESNNIGFGGKLGAGNFIVRYAPSANTTEGNDIDNNINADTGTTFGSGYIVAYSGSAGPVGFAVSRTVVQQADDAVANTDDLTEQRVSLSYNFGTVKVGADYNRFEKGAAADAGDIKTLIVGAAYAVNDKVSIGAYRQVTSDESSAGNLDDEEINMITIGYNLGPASVALSVVDVQGASSSGASVHGGSLNAANTAADYQGLMITTKVGF